jgi:hypothetical protein
MAITRAQQVRQMLEDGGMLVSPSLDGKRPGYRSAAAQSSRTGGSSRTGSSSSSSSDTSSDSGNDGGDDRRESYITDYSSQAKVKGGGEKKGTKGGAGDEGYDYFQYTKDNRTKAMEDKFARDRGLTTLNLLRAGVPKSNLPGFLGMGLNALIPFRNFSLNKNIDFFQNDPRTRKAREKYGLSAEGYQNYMSARLAGEIDAAGNPLNQGDDDDDNQILFPEDMKNNTGDDSDDEDDTNTGGMAFRFMSRGGSPMDAPTEGGIMDLETGRQMYFLGKLVKKATRAVKKIAKSPIGKAALLYGAGTLGASFLGKTQAAGGIGKFLFGQGMKPGFSGPGIPGLFNKLGLTKTAGSLMPTIKGGIALASLTPLLFGQQEEEEEGEFDRGPGLDIDYIRNNPYTFIPRRFAAEGGDIEPVAKKTMPLLDMDGKEMDLREDGGFVPIGRMEKADDVPARLSKNEFVFTADAVRNAGEGDVDKGAEVMYNMMKNLESGGEVSEESQGLQGARKMFQTSKRLEEVL